MAVGYFASLLPQAWNSHRLQVSMLRDSLLDRDSANSTLARDREQAAAVCVIVGVVSIRCRVQSACSKTQEAIFV